MTIQKQSIMGRALRGGGRVLAAGFVLAALWTLAAACHLTDVSNPDIVPTGGLAITGGAVRATEAPTTPSSGTTTNLVPPTAN